MTMEVAKPVATIFKWHPSPQVQAHFEVEEEEVVNNDTIIVAATIVLNVATTPGVSPAAMAAFPLRTRQCQHALL